MLETNVNAPFKRAPITEKDMELFFLDEDSFDESQTVRDDEVDYKELKRVEDQLKDEKYTETHVLNMRMSIGRGNGAQIDLGVDRISRGEKIRVYPVARGSSVEWMLINEGTFALNRNDQPSERKIAVPVKDGDVFTMGSGTRDRDLGSEPVVAQMKFVAKGKYMVMGVKEDISYNRPSK